MKTIFYLWSVVTIICISMVSCESDDDISVTPSPENMYELIGEWVALGDEGEFTLLNLEVSHQVTGQANISLPESKMVVVLKGFWKYFKNRGVLVLSGDVANSGHSSTISYQVRKVNKDCMILFNQETMSEQQFKRIEGRMEIYSGEKIEGTGISWVSDENIINHETGMSVGYGMCYVEDASGRLLAVNVLHRTEKMMNLVMRDIDSVIAEYGEPDVTGVIGNNKGCLYNKKEIDRKNLLNLYSAVQFQYDDATREITRILVKYDTSDDFLMDYEYFLKEYKQDGEFFYRGDNSSYLEVDYAVDPFLQNGTCYCSYNNISYYLTHNYF